MCRRCGSPKHQHPLKESQANGTQSLQDQANGTQSLRDQLKRRSFLKTSAVAGMTAALGSKLGAVQASDTECDVADRFVSSPNYSDRDASIDWIVMHVTVGSYDGAISWFENPDSNVSAHYVVSNYDDTAYDPGHVTQMVAHEDAAWHARYIANHRSIGIELEWIDGHNSDEPISEECYAAAADIVRCVADEYDIPLTFYEEETCIPNEDGGIIGHTHVPDGDCDSYDHDGRTCPYPDFDPETFMSYVDSDGDDDAFEDGDTVVATTALNGREGPSLDSDVVTILSEGTTAEVMNGPEQSDGYTWWGLFVPDEGVWVWAVEAYLALEDEDDEPTVTVETDGETGIGETTATLQGTVTDLQGTDEASVRFEYGPSGEGFIDDTEPESVGSGESVSHDVSGLSDGTTYEFRAVATADETTTVGETKTFETEEDEDDSGGCFLTTATADDPATLHSLRRFRDNSMAATPLGQALIRVYYAISPPIAETLSRHPNSRTVRVGRALVDQCARLSDAQAATDSRPLSVLYGVALTLLYIVGILIAATGHTILRTQEGLRSN